MRQIKFRGQKINTIDYPSNREWVYGTGITDFLNVYPDIKGHIWLWSNYGWIEVIPSTVGHGTGLIGFANKEIYEGDMVKFKGMYKGIIVWREDHAEFGIKWREGTEREGTEREWTASLGIYEADCFEIIGTIHDDKLQSESRGK